MWFDATATTPDLTSGTSIWVTVITTLGVVIVAFISTRHSNKAEVVARPPQTDDQAHDGQQDQRLAVVEYRIDQVEKRVQRLEDEP